jgi:4-diphosphocytidyl-2-C-methyl-D-erythritol kinase
LYITGVLPNGYHILDSIVAPIDLCDEIELSFGHGDGIEVFCDNFQGENNIVYKAIHAFKQHYPSKSKIIAKIKKSIPHGAGLGGGSSDAASVLLQLNEHYEYPLSMDKLISVAVSIGADVPNFFHKGCRRMTGIGEIVEPVNGQRHELLLVVPDMPLQTKEVYAIWDNISVPEIPPAFDLRQHNPHNSLQTASVTLCPEIASIVDTLLNLGAKKACMTGSGSVVFGWFENEKRANDALFCLSDRWKLIRTKTY